MAFCHNHLRVYQRNLTHQYFTKSCKNNYSPCHNHQHVSRRHHRWMAHIPMRATVRLPSQSAQLSTASPMDAANPMRACSETILLTDVPTDFEKSGGILKNLVRNSKNTDEIECHRPKNILLYVSSVSLTVKLQYKTDLPLHGSFFLGSSHFFSSPPANHLCFSLYFYCFYCSFQHIKRYDSPSFIFVIFLLFLI